MRAVVVASDMITPYGTGTDACWEGLMAGRTAVSRVARFKTQAFHSDYAGMIAGLTYHETESLAMQMLTRLFERAGGLIPRDARLLLATTKGEIDLLEKSVLDGIHDGSASVPSRLLNAVANFSYIIPFQQWMHRQCDHPVSVFFSIMQIQRLKFLK